MRYGSATALAVSGAVAALPAQAQEVRHRIDIGAADLPAALAQLAAQTGASFASEGPLPRPATPRVRGTMTASQALARLLGKSLWQAVRVGPNAYRIVRRPAAPPQTAPVVAPVADAAPVETVVIVGRKRIETLSRVPAPLAVYRPGGNRPPSAATTRDAARSVEGVTLTGAGPGRERLFIRGVADSPFTGFSQATVSVQLDEARISFDGPEPGVRLIDIDRVEILKGPQGPLYGTGALGGVFRIVTNRPGLDSLTGQVGVGVSGVAGGGVGAEAHGIINLPLIRDRIGLRLVGYAARDAGWIDDADGRRNVNRGSTRGARGALRLVPFSGWTVDLTAVGQDTDLRDSQYADAAAGRNARHVPVAEPYRGRLRSYQATATGSVGSLRLTLATGLTLQSQSQRHDASLAPPIAGTVQPTYIDSYRSYRVFDQEVRIGSAPGSAIDWVAGASFLLARTDDNVVGWAGDGAIPLYVAANRRVTETALFADATVPLVARVRLGAGMRLFRAATRDDRFDFQTLSARATTLFAATPSLSLSYTLRPDALLFARVATAFRPGGLDPGNSMTRRFEADEVRNLDLGGRVALDGGRLHLEASLFRTDWRNMQTDYLQSSGLIATRNAGQARIHGAEVSIDWRGPDGWQVHAGATWQRPRLTDPLAGGNAMRLPTVPDIAARLSLAREWAVSGWRVTPSLSADGVGARDLALDANDARRMPARLSGRIGVAAERDTLSLRVDIDNLFDTAADEFALGNPFAARSVRQITPDRPRTLSLSATRRF